MSARLSDLDLPPVIGLLISEKLHEVDTPQALARRLTDHGLVKDLTDQASRTFGQYRYEEDRLPGDNQLLLTPSASMDPFSSIGKCTDRKCRIGFADSFLRSLGLYADKIAVTDFFTGVFLDDTVVADELYTELAVLRRLLPLITHRILRFNSSVLRFCETHYQANEDLVRRTTQSMASRVRSDFAVDIVTGRNDVLVCVKSPLLGIGEEDGLAQLFRLTPRERAQHVRDIGEFTRRKRLTKRLLELILGRLAPAMENDVRGSLAALTNAGRTRSALATGSRIESLWLAELDGRGPAMTSVENWESLRSLQLPWVNELTADQIIDLRGEAASALPRLRALLAKRFGDMGDDSDKRVSDVLAELRVDALDVEAELQASRPIRSLAYRVGTEALAISLVIYGLAVQAPVAVAGGVATLLNAIAHSREEERQTKDHKKLLSKPAYVLVKAKELRARH